MSQNSIALPAFAKINLYLRVLGKRDDGFHEVCTVLQTVSLYDQLTFAEHKELILTCNDQTVPTGESNLIIKAAIALQEKFNVKKGALIDLKKNIPSPGGLGGGSADCAAALLGLAKIWNLKSDFEDLIEIGKTLGSDIPFFFYGGTALATGRGTEIFPLEDLKENHLLIVKPNVQVATGEAFARLNSSHLTNKNSKSILKICRNEARRLNLRHTALINDFEKSVFEFAPEIARVKKRLFELGAVQALLSGSGASVFAVFENEETRQASIKALDEEQNWHKFAVATISRSAYREALKPCGELFPISF